VAHHLTHRAIDTNVVARQRLLQIMKAVPEEVTGGVTSILTDPHEFVAEAYSNPEFRASLKGIRVPGVDKNLWEKFKSFVRRVIGNSEKDISAFDAIMELKLTDPKTIQERGRGDLSENLNNLMLRKKVPKNVQEAVELASYAADPTQKAGLAVLTLDQIVNSYGRMATEHNAENGQSVNHLEEIAGLQDRRAAFIAAERDKFYERVSKPLRAFAIGEGTKSISVQMEPGAGKPKVDITQLQLLAELMNNSGYGQIHLGKDALDKANVMLLGHPRKNPPKPGKDRKRTRSDIYYDHFKPIFDKDLHPEARKLYNDISAYTLEMHKMMSTLTAKQFLDNTEPRQDGKSWFEIDTDVVQAEIKRVSKLDDKELSKLGLIRDNLNQLKQVLKTGRAPGAYFPMRSFGEFIVTVNQNIPFNTEEERDQLLNDYLGAKVIDREAKPTKVTKKGKVIPGRPARKEINYKAVARFESEYDAGQWAAAMREKYPDAAVSTPLVASDTDIAKKVGIDVGLINQFTKRINTQKIPQAAKDAQIRMFTQSMIDLLPEASYANSFRQRQGVLGRSLDIQRIFDAYGSAAAHYAGASVFSTKQRDANAAFQKFIYAKEDLSRGKKPEIAEEAGRESRRLRRVHNELALRESNMATVFTEGKYLRIANNIGFGYMLVGASYNLINMSQTILMTHPHLAGRFGDTQAFLAMKRAYAATGGTVFSRLVKTGFTLSKLRGMFAGEDFDRSNYDVLTEMIDRLDPSAHGKPRKGPVSAQDAKDARVLVELAKLNRIDQTVSMDMTSSALHSHIDPITGKARPQSKISYLTDWMKMAPHITEVLNRSVTGLAAYNLEHARVLKEGKTAEEAHTAAIKYAVKTIDQTQFNYQPHNKPRIIQRNSWARAMLMFKQHPQHILFYMASRVIRSSNVLRKRALGHKLAPDEVAEANEGLRQLARMMGMAVLASGAIGGTPEPLKWIIGLLSMLFGTDDEPFNFELMVLPKMASLPMMGGCSHRAMSLAH
jgi:hypothetical protein